jgi:hypothetical protein
MSGLKKWIRGLRMMGVHAACTGVDRSVAHFLLRAVFEDLGRGELGVLVFFMML